MLVEFCNNEEDTILKAFKKCEFLSVVNAPFVADNIVSVAYSAPFSPSLL